MAATHTYKSRKELLRRIGNMSQAGGTRSVELQEGSERGVRAIDFDTGTGFRFTVLPDRGMDIFDASYCGCSLCFHSLTGAVAPAYYQQQGFSWLWGFYGGLVHTCGLTQVGTPVMDGDEELGLHGRVSHIPARNVSHGTRWEGDDCIMFAEGIVREARIFAAKLQLTRRITARLGENRFFIHDEVENIGYEPAPHMILYHCNIGYPVLDDGARVVTPTESVKPLNDITVDDMEYVKLSGPVADYEERCYEHTLKPDKNGMIRLALVNDAFDGGRGIGVYISYKFEQLPRLIQWKMLGEGTYVVGLEPANCTVKGRVYAREEDDLVVLQPGEKREYDLEIGVESPTG